jgi:L-phenylalanine/L-methionine N-acetyltransferase
VPQKLVFQYFNRQETLTIHSPRGLRRSVGEEVVGCLGLEIHSKPRRRHAGAIGMAIRDDYQGKGIGTALMQAAVDMADRWLNLTRLELEVYTDNEPAIRLYKKFGFTIEGTLRNYAFRDGAFADAYSMARLRDDRA